MDFPARRTAGAFARLLVVLLTLGTSVPVAAHGDAGHDPCDAATTAADRAGLHAAGPDVPPQHCDVCHWLRSLRAFDVDVDRPAARAAISAACLPAAASSASRLSVPRAPSRAPPA
jgi:hypothetical protein